jgi:hypothetical protein
MPERLTLRLRPSIQLLEAKQLLSAGAHITHLLDAKAGSDASDLGFAATTLAASRSGAPEFIMNRITNPTPFNARLSPPFMQVLVQSTRPVPGAEYNVLSLSVRNSTARTFDARNGFSVKVTGQHLSFPILTGAERWKPGQVIVFYILTKKYYPLRPVVAAGFQFNFASGTAIPGPSGIFLRIKYNPATFSRVLDWIVTRGPGAKGHELGLPDTAIWEFLSAKTDIVPL